MCVCVCHGVCERVSSLLGDKEMQPGGKLSLSWRVSPTEWVTLTFGGRSEGSRHLCRHSSRISWDSAAESPLIRWKSHSLARLPGGSVCLCLCACVCDFCPASLHCFCKSFVLEQQHFPARPIRVSLSVNQSITMPRPPSQWEQTLIKTIKKEGK